MDEILTRCKCLPPGACSSQRKKFEALVPECFICAEQTKEVLANCGHPCHADCAKVGSTEGLFQCPTCTYMGDTKIVLIVDPMIKDEAVSANFAAPS